MKRYQELGADLLVFDFRMRFADWLDQIEQIGEEVIPKVQARVPALDEHRA